ncbi:hypothetical protein PR048_019870 [Dryococelus australis]|uniref:Reverse transcriptase RNase H-like domain-containing protein n=1 Tax=Dryococelus australis TaxID=614101 RepID=A0ABQ9H513_9NEOP|nr:hypothetical protein PR048_019870 [Dryococelus australis]
MVEGLFHQKFTVWFNRENIVPSHVCGLVDLLYGAIPKNLNIRPSSCSFGVDGSSEGSFSAINHRAVHPHAGSVRPLDVGLAQRQAILLMVLRWFHSNRAMESFCRLPDLLDLSSNVADNWKRFKEREPDLDLQREVCACKASEVTRLQTKILQEVKTAPVVSPAVCATQSEPRPHRGHKKGTLWYYGEVKDKLDELEAKQIIRKVEKPIEWVNTLAISEKSNKDISLCLDPKYLNLVLKREHFVIRTPQDIAARMDRNSFFTVLDLKVPIDLDSIDLCMFETPYGRYQFLRMPFGIKPVPEVFKKKLRNVWGFTREGVQKDDEYTRVIVGMKASQSKEELLRFLGMVRFVGKFTPNLSQVSAPLWGLSRQDVDWNLEEHEVRHAQVEKEFLAIQFATVKFHHFIYGHYDVTIFTDYKPLVSIRQQDINNTGLGRSEKESRSGLGNILEKLGSTVRMGRDSTIGN